MGSSQYTVLIDTAPTGASVTVKNGARQVIYEGNTPATLKLRSSQAYMSRAEYIVSAKAPGYKAGAMSIYGTVDGYYWANFIFGGLIGWFLVDPVTGAMYRLDKQYVLKLDPE